MGRTVGIHVVFTDFVGPVDAAPAADPDLRGEQFGLLRRETAAHGGREVRVVGHGLMVVFPSLVVALDASVAMQRAVAGDRAAGGQAGLRIGLSSGDATEDDDDVAGPPVAEAARFCARAEGGQILTSELIARMARKTGHRFRPIGGLDLREEPEPVPAVVVRWEPAPIALA